MARLGELLVAAGLVTTDQVEQALRAQVMWGARLGTNLIELGYIDLDGLSTVLAQQHKMPAALARHFEKVDRDLQRSLHPDLAEMYTCIPLVRVRDRDIVVASSSPLTKKAQARVADELAVEPDQIILAVAAELRMRYQLERVYNIQRPARFMRSPGKTIPPFPTQFDVESPSDPEIDGAELLEVEPALPEVDEIKSTQPFLATYTAPTAKPRPTTPPSFGTKPVPTVDDDMSIDIDMDDSSPRTPAPTRPAIANLPFTKPSLPIPGVEPAPAPVVLQPRTMEARTGVTTPEPSVPERKTPSTPPSSVRSQGRIEIVVPPSEHEMATVPVAKLEEREVTIASEAPPVAKPEPTKPGVVKPIAKPASKFPSVAKFDAIADADDSQRIETAIPTVVPQDTKTAPVHTPDIARPKAAPVPAPTKPLPSILKKPAAPEPEPEPIAIPTSVTLDTVIADPAVEDDGVPDHPRRPGSESDTLAVPNPRAVDMADLDALSAEVDDALSIPQPVEDDKSSGRERRRYLRTIADEPSTESERTQSLGRMKIRRMAVAKPAPSSAADGHTLGEATRAIRRATNRDRVADLCVDTMFRFAPSCVAAALFIVRGQVATTWKGFIRDGSPPPEIAVPLEQPGLIPKAVHRNATVRAPATDLGPIDQLLMVSLAQTSGDLVIVPISIAKQVMCVIALVTDAEPPIATAESVAAGAGAAFARLMRDASR